MGVSIEKSTSGLGGQRKQRGCLFWGLVATASACLLAVLCALVAFRYVRGKALEHTDTGPATIPIEQVTPAQARALDRETRGFIQAVDRGQPASIELTAWQLNALIAIAPQFRGLRGKARVSIEDDRVLADTSLSLNAVPGLRGRYLNGRVELHVRVRSGRLDLDLLGIEAKGKPVPGVVLDLLSEGLAEEARKRHDVKEVLSRIESLDVREGKVMIRVRQAGEGGREL